MLLGKVVGSAVATIKPAGLTGVKLMVVQLLDKHDKPIGKLQVAADTAQAGVGDRVFMVRALEAAAALEDSFVPVDLAIIGIVDSTPTDDSIDNFELPMGITRF